MSASPPAPALAIAAILGATAGQFEALFAQGTEALTLEPGRAAFVCCDGGGDFDTCWGAPLPQSPWLLQCIVEHETDHADWLRENAAAICAARPRGSHLFEMTPRQQRELECRGYRRELSCLRRSLRLSNRSELPELLQRRRQLLRLAADRFGCSGLDL